MQNFSQLQAIDPTLLLKITLLPINRPNLIVTSLNSLMFQGRLEYETILVATQNLLDPVDFSITLVDKVYTEVEQAVIVSCIMVDDKDYTSLLVAQSRYNNDHAHAGPTNYIGFNGTWNISSEKPFYHWLHDVMGQGWLLEPGI